MIVLLSLVLIAYTGFCALSAFSGGSITMSLVAGAASAVTASGFLLRKRWAIWTWYALAAWTIAAWAFWLLPAYLRTWAKPNIVEYLVNLYPSTFPLAVCIAGTVIARAFSQALVAETRVQYSTPARVANTGFVLLLVGFAAMFLMTHNPLASYAWLGSTVVGIFLLLIGAAWLAASAVAGRP
jgi:hypothetical protein